MIKKLIQYTISAVLFVILFGLVQRLVEPKYADNVPEGNFTSEYYSETISHDVVMIGDCEVYEAFDPIYLWRNFGISSYIRGNAQQLTWQSYYMLEDTLRYETPKVVVYGVQALTHDSPQREEYNRMTLDGMRWSDVKVKAVGASMCKGENFIDYLFPLFRYHSRITNLTKEDVEYFAKRKKVSHNGYYMRIDALPLSESEYVDGSWLLGQYEETEDTETMESMETITDPWAMIDDGDNETEGVVSEQTDPAKKHTVGEEFGAYPMEYLDKIRTLCGENGITLIFTKAPSLEPQWYDTDEEQVSAYAEKYNIPYINFYDLLEETGIDYETDTYDGGFHLNLSGADKLSEYLGRQLADIYGVPDRREDEKYCKAYGEKEDFYDDMVTAQMYELDMYGEIKSY